MSSGGSYCLLLGLSESGAVPDAGCFAAGERRGADAGAELVGCGAAGGAAACAGGAGAGGSAFMMLTGGIEAADGKVTFGPAGTPDGVPPLEASGRVRDGQFTA